MQPAQGRGGGHVTGERRWGHEPTTRLTRGERARGLAFDLTWMGFEQLRGRPFGIGVGLVQDGFGGLGEGVSAVGSGSGAGKRKDKTVTSDQFVGVGPATGKRTEESELYVIGR